MSIWDTHYAALYASPIAVDASLTIACGEVPISLRAIDKTNPAAIGFKGVDVLDIKPAATIRASDLAGIDLANLRDAELILNGTCWRVASHQALPAPTGEAGGEIMLILSET
ncbi:MAG: hypothetical protein E5V37_03330 [Mesorhizobium sp.]|uniref:hypothetical protein n=1 Tax=unclassified Mesorhizobium TaxID=325217 RepID=UPI000FC9A293|nr:MULTISPECIES: hypothetical protein [unclassified Mesorhizobium]RUW42991.1 hypothetical protein EOA37_02225 [Mesorhizobium sp. M2A.F.Ca.ET.015.02.1.1]RVC93062.1 hypothetical protein EN739_22955 [Mesorhizobium sp. M2A.F.Ca.ET.017.03.2.1]RVD02557.1 hypothetical protein EN753_22645 [Mesorhizobium sp. M2A.F.Ca.ET.029.05.1.1]RWB47579.1 MAG: hypothetical protein EOQ46_05975 [Mesorhizobium sp.]RWB62089.1 MAG: hypothetical protein EOQ48_11720 [Mesorhizobium sp.]